MQYELYIDIFFLTNFVLDFFLLQIVRKMLKCTATHGNIVKGAFCGAGLTSMIVCLPVDGIWKVLIAHLAVNTLMLRIAFKVRKNRLVKAWILLYVVGFSVGGILISIGQYMGKMYKYTILFLFVSICGYGISYKLMEFLETYWKIEETKCKVMLYLDGQTCELSAIKDIGNMLYDKISGKPVHIISANAIKKFTVVDCDRFRYIPYHTVQGDNRMMPLIRMDKMCVSGKKGIVIQNPLIGISERTHFGNEEYDLILNPKDL